MLSNSEVGHSALKATIGLLDFVCGNMILWGCQEVYEARLTHRRNVRDRFERLLAPMTHRLGSGDKDTLKDQITAASRKLLGETRDAAIATAAIRTKLPKASVTQAYERAAATPRYGDPRSVWGMVQGLTEESQHATTFADARTDMDRAAARLLAAF